MEHILTLKNNIMPRKKQFTPNQDENKVLIYVLDAIKRGKWDDFLTNTINDTKGYYVETHMSLFVEEREILMNLLTKLQIDRNN